MFPAYAKVGLRYLASQLSQSSPFINLWRSTVLSLPFHLTFPGRAWGLDFTRFFIHADVVREELPVDRMTSSFLLAKEDVWKSHRHLIQVDSTLYKISTGNSNSTQCARNTRYSQKQSKSNIIKTNSWIIKIYLYLDTSDGQFQSLLKWAFTTLY